ncbi:AMP-binding protein [Actinomadura sp. DC4]|uniref:AMP-binding protein n=1 Tax=Actinomadura sp. DC4 TaxID=3055069 RepID=UPI0025B1616D|nr:AMP-binding protein [Actinomadura sp. DC4]MDN3356359.1 AMP-binding protein [Actinomadura sp. DC4]
MRSFSAYAAGDPSRVAIVDRDGSRITYAELAGRADRLSRAIAAAGPGRPATVAALLPNAAVMLLAERATLQLPTYFTPVNWHLTAGEAAYIIQDSAAELLLTAGEFLATALAAADEAGLARERVIVLDGAARDGARTLAEFTAGQPATPPAGRSAGQRMLYTSGTTGRPKGVRRRLPEVSPEKAAATVLARAELYGAAHEDGTYLSVAPLYHAAPLAYAVQSLEAGHTVVMLPRWDPAEALRAIAEHGVTWTYLVPLMFAELLALEPGARGAYDIGSLRSVVHTAAPCPEPLKRAMIEWFGPILAEIYGGTEGGATFIDSRDWLAHPGSVGRARAGVRLSVLDEAGTELGPGEIGTVYFSGPADFEYWNDPDKTATTRTGGLTTLGDIGYLDEDGYLFLRDRASDVIVSGGVNIYPAEIEQVLLRHPGVADVCVVGAPDERWGERVFAAVVPRDGVPPSDELARSIQDFLRERIAGYKVPRDIEFRSSVPRSEVGKLLRRGVREALWRDAGSRL